MVISRVVIRVSKFRARITLLITYLLSPLPLQAGSCFLTGSEGVSILASERFVEGGMRDFVQFSFL